MHYPDLSPYSYFETPNNDELRHLDHLRFLNIGWLQAGTAFPVGETPPGFPERLLGLCRRPVVCCMGYHECDLCVTCGGRDSGIGQGPELALLAQRIIVRRDDGDVYLGNGEVAVAGRDGKGYRAPTLVYHCVTAHFYRPPEEFIEAVMACPLRSAPWWRRW